MYIDLKYLKRGVFMEDNTKKMFKLALLMLVLLMISKACSINHAGALDDAFINYSSQKNIENTDN